MKRLRTGLALLPLLAFSLTPSLQSQTTTQMPEATYSPIANPKAVVIEGHARFTVLTPQLIRIEWAADGKFEDHPSFVFLNRRLPVPKFTQLYEQAGAAKQLTIKTDALTLTYRPGASNDGKFTPDNLTITLQLDGKPVTWHPGMPDTGNLLGTTRTLDGALGGKTKEPMGEGLISRDGWALVDDSTRPLFDSDNFTFAQGEKSEWPWVMERPAGDEQDWYFFGYGHDYKQALHDYVTACWSDSPASAFCLRSLVVALLGLQRSGIGQPRPQLPRQ